MVQYILKVGICVSFMVLAKFQFGQAQETLDTITAQHTFQVVEINAGGLNQIPYQVSELNRIKILENNGLTLEPLLQQIPGIWMQTGAPNTNRISIRGVGNREPFATSKLRVYLDEIPLTNGVGESSIEDIDPMLYESIEVWKSPTSALWGSGLGGMIQLQPAWNGEEKLRLSSQIGSFGQWNSSALFRKNYGSNDQHQTILHGQYARQDGFRENNEYNKGAFTLMHKWSVNTKFSLQAFAHLIKLKARIPSSLGRTAFNDSPESAAFTWGRVKGNEDYDKGIFGVGARYVINQKLSYQASIFSNYFDSDEVRPFNVLKEKSFSFGTRQRGIYAINTTDFFTVGFEYYHERYDAQTFETLDGGIGGPQLSDETEKRNHTTLFIQYHEQFLQGISLLLGASYSKSGQKQTNNPFRQSAFSPTLGLNYETQIDGLALFASISRGFSPLSISDALGSDGVINNDLKPEKGWSTEAGIKFAARDKSYGGNITAYFMRISNLFVQKRIALDQFEGANAGKTIHDGLEVEFWYRPNEKFSFNSSYAFSDHQFSEFIDGQNDHSDNALTGTAPHMLFNRVSMNFTNWMNIKLSHRAVAKTPITDDNKVFGEGFQILNAAINFRPINNSSNNLSLRFGIDNIFDAKYASMYQINARGFGNSEPRFYYPGLPRNVHFRVLYDFK